MCWWNPSFHAPSTIWRQHAFIHRSKLLHNKKKLHINLGTSPSGNTRVWILDHCNQSINQWKKTHSFSAFCHKKLSTAGCWFDLINSNHYYSIFLKKVVSSKGWVGVGSVHGNKQVVAESQKKMNWAKKEKFFSAHSKSFICNNLSTF